MATDPKRVDHPSERERLAPGDEAPAGTAGAGENVCRTCKGTGEIDMRPCPACEGTGVVEEGIGGA